MSNEEHGPDAMPFYARRSLQRMANFQNPMPYWNTVAEVVGIEQAARMRAQWLSAFPEFQRFLKPEKGVG